MLPNIRPSIRISITLLAFTLATFAGHWQRAVAQDRPTAPPPPPPRPGHHNHEGHAPASQPQMPPPTTRPLSKLAPGEYRLALKFEGGHDTDPRDHGRPVTLIAAALKVPENVFRETFTHVHPAGRGSGGPTDAQARQNKQALMADLSPCGVTDERLNAVSNYYRYMKQSHDDLWQHRDASGYAVVKNNKVVRFDLVDPGAGYTTPPKVMVENMADVNVTAKLEFGTYLATNGSIKSLAVAKPSTTPLP